MNIEQYHLTEDIIFHIVNKQSIQGILKETIYCSPTLETEGFIHMSTKEQVAWVIETFYKNSEELYVLGIDKRRLEATLKYEAAAGIAKDLELPEQKVFPHLYGPLNVDAIVNIIEGKDFFEQEVDEEIKSLIEYHKFERLPVEGTYYNSTYASNITFGEDRIVGTSMIGMYSKNPLSLSCFHRLKHDEVWHAYGGDSLRLVLLYQDGTTKEVILGHDISKGEVPQYIVPANTWQAGEVVDGGRYALFGCTMAPGFHHEDFEAGLVDELKKYYPERLFDILKFNINGNLSKMSEL